jgi:hypothetical protein
MSWGINSFNIGTQKRWDRKVIHHCISWILLFYLSISWFCLGGTINSPIFSHPSASAVLPGNRLPKSAARWSTCPREILGIGPIKTDRPKEIWEILTNQITGIWWDLRIQPTANWMHYNSCFQSEFTHPYKATNALLNPGRAPNQQPSLEVFIRTFNIISRISHKWIPP